MAASSPLSVSTFIRRHPALTYYALVFVVSWGAILGVIGPGAFLGRQQMPAARLPFVYLATLAGPSIAGLALTGLVSGKKGFRDMLARLATWRVGARWYAVALLTVPVLTTLALVLLSLTSPAFQPAITTSTNPIVLVVSGIMVGLVVGFFEESGWTGFALPELRKGHGVLTTGLLMGLLWGSWHFPLFAGSAKRLRGDSARSLCRRAPLLVPAAISNADGVAL
jgi:membrane protease YdiL (CAAX protease family)